MKRVYLLMMTMSLVVLGANATNITVAQAQAVAQRFTVENKMRFASSNAGQDLQLAHVARNEGFDADYYVFNLKDDGGYVIVGGDDLALPVWGYSTHGAFEFDKIPENMRWWLSEYQRQLEWLRSHPDAAAHQAVSLSSSVSPLISSTWHQNAPFNNLCPTIMQYGVPQRTPSGCLATAMAQIMYYYLWPKKGDGDHTYTYTPRGSSPMTLSADFSQSTYEWNKILSSYNGNYTSAQGDAVARLLRDVGISIETEYNINESFAYYKNSIEAFMAYFDYSPSMSYLLKSKYTGDWDELLRSELDTARPIFYFGQNPDNAGHAFILDGYNSTGYFHVNWGWGGRYDGYFLTSLMRPYSPTDNPNQYNYSYSQGAIIGIQPDDTGTGGIVLKSGIKPAASTMPADNVKASFDVEAVGGPYNGILKLVVCTKNENGSYSWYNRDVTELNVSLAAGQRKTIVMNRSFNLNEGQTYYFFLIDPYVTVANYSWCPAVPFTVGDMPVVGDVNGDGEVTVADINSLINIVLGGVASTEQLTRADVNGDHEVTIADVNSLIGIILNN